MQIKVLDHGFVRLHNIASHRSLTYASDRDIAQVARMSFDNLLKDTTEEQDLKLAAYLMRNKHTTPFEDVEVWIEMKLPIFVARQFVRHRTVTINEVSARYVTLPQEWYLPAPEHVGVKPPTAKQGRGPQADAELVQRFLDDLNTDCSDSYNRYLYFINEGLAPELARLFLHLNHYTHWMWKQDLHNIMHFLSLRDHFHAQLEAQAYAKAVDGLIRHHLPHTMSLYDAYRRQISPL